MDLPPFSALRLTPSKRGLLEIFTNMGVQRKTHGAKTKEDYTPIG
jgi:hypothetical protein